MFLGCFPCDLLPSPDSLQYPKALIVNFDSHEKEGSHWVAIYAQGRQRDVIYFDSLALPIPPLIINFLNKFPRIKRNLIPFQSPLANTCAHYTIYFIYYLSQGHSFDNFLHQLNITVTNIVWSHAKDAEQRRERKEKFRSIYLKKQNPGESQGLLLPHTKTN